jgi:hypothetical protein
MANGSLKQRCRVVELLLFNPPTAEIPGRIHQRVTLAPLSTEKDLSMYSLYCWQDIRSFSVGEEVDITIESASD